MDTANLVYGSTQNQLSTMHKSPNTAGIPVNNGQAVVYEADSSQSSDGNKSLTTPDNSKLKQEVELPTFI